MIFSCVCKCITLTWKKSVQLQLLRLWCHKLIINTSRLDWKHKYKVEIRYEQQMASWCVWSNTDPPDTTVKELFLQAVGWRGLWNWKNNVLIQRQHIPVTWLPGSGLLYVRFEYLHYKTLFRWADLHILYVQRVKATLVCLPVFPRKSKQKWEKKYSSSCFTKDIFKIRICFCK